jgi:hypothetical protein
MVIGNEKTRLAGSIAYAKYSTGEGGLTIAAAERMEDLQSRDYSLRSNDP